jgi:hypothetical protein
VITYITSPVHQLQFIVFHQKSNGDAYLFTPGMSFLYANVAAGLNWLVWSSSFLFRLPAREMLPFASVFREEDLVRILNDRHSTLKDNCGHTSTARNGSSASALKNLRKIKLINCTRSLYGCSLGSDLRSAKMVLKSARVEAYVTNINVNASHCPSNRD